MYDAIYIRNTQQTFKKIMDDHFSYILSILKSIHKLYSFAAHSQQYFNATTSRTDILKFMTFKVVNQLNPIGAMRTFTKPNCNLYMEECLKILKQLRDKHSSIYTSNV